MKKPGLCEEAGLFVVRSPPKELAGIARSYMFMDLLERAMPASLS
jgi:hypothetical protein